MSITVADCLALPSLSIGKVIGGARGLHRTVSTVTVIEFSSNDDVIAVPNELVITAFHAFRDDPVAQCETIRYLKNCGDAGLVIFYSDIILGKVGESLIATANEINFPLILLPGDEWSLAYSDVINEVMSAVINSDHTTDSYVTNVIEHISKTPPEERSLDYLLETASHYTGGSFVLCDNQYRMITHAIHTSHHPLQGESLLMPLVSSNYKRLIVHSDMGYLYQYEFHSRNHTPLILVGYGLDAAYAIKTLADTAETIRLFSALWNYNLISATKESVIPALLEGKHERCSAIATQHHLKLTEYRTMICIPHVEAISIDQIYQLARKHDIKSLLDTLNETIVIFLTLDLSSTRGGLYLDELMQGCNLTFASFPIRDIWSTPGECYHLFCTNIASASKIYPLQRHFNRNKLQMADRCKRILLDDTMVKYYEALVSPILQIGEDALFETLATFLLDCNREINKTANTLFLHRNTVLYRLNKIKKIFDQPIEEMPFFFELYMATALYRLGFFENIHTL